MQRFAVPAALLLTEYLALSLLVDFPASGPAARLVEGARLVVPVVLGAGAAGVLIAWNRPRAGSPLAALPLNRPWPGLLAHVAAFVVTALLAYRLLGPNAASPTVPEFVAWLACVALTAALALTMVAPPGALLRLAARHLGIPILAVAAGLLSWRALAAAERLWGVLQERTLGAVAALLSLFSAKVFVDPPASVIGLGDFQVQIAPICSGVDGLGLVLVFQALWLSLARSTIRLRRALALLVPIGAAAALLANVVRISVLVYLGGSGHERFALGAFHSKAGWLLFMAIAFATIAAAERLRWLRAEPNDAGERAGLPPDAAAHIAPLLAALAVALVTSLWAEPGLDRWYAARILAAGVVLLLVRRSLPAPALSFSWVPLLLGAAVSAAWVLWGSTPRSALAEALAQLGPTERALWIAARLGGSILVVPVIEELAFRGFLLRWLAPPGSEAEGRGGWPWFAILMSSLAFGAIHERWLLGAAAGVAFAAARLWRNRLGDAIVAHAIANAAVAAATLFFKKFELWG